MGVGTVLHRPTPSPENNFIYRNRKRANYCPLTTRMKIPTAPLSLFPKDHTNTIQKATNVVSMVVGGFLKPVFLTMTRT
jgi:hypothetical protein